MGDRQRHLQRQRLKMKIKETVTRLGKSFDTKMPFWVSDIILTLTHMHRHTDGHLSEAIRGFYIRFLKVTDRVILPWT